MKKYFAGAVSLVALAVAAPAMAADLGARSYTKAPPTYVAAIYDWSGFYIGANGGWGQANESGTLVPGGFNLGSHKASGAVAGGQIGYRWQAGTWVFGLEAQGNWADLKGNHSVFGATIGDLATSKLDAFGLFTGQVGYAWNNALLYVKGGAAVTSNRYDYDLGAADYVKARKDTRWGGAVGAGLEYGFRPELVGRYRVRPSLHRQAQHRLLRRAGRGADGHRADRRRRRSGHRAAELSLRRPGGRALLSDAETRSTKKPRRLRRGFALLLRWSRSRDDKERQPRRYLLISGRNFFALAKSASPPAMSPAPCLAPPRLYSAVAVKVSSADAATPDQSRR